MKRSEVYAAVDTERDHQDRKWGTVQQHPHEVGGWLTIMRKLLNDADTAWASRAGEGEALHEIRKVIATGVACAEQHGLTPRWNGALKERMREPRINDGFP